MRLWIVGLFAFITVVSCGGSGGVKADGPWAEWEADVSSKVETSIDTSMLFFNSRDPFFKTPFGAMEQGSTVSLKFLSKKSDVQKINVIISTQQMIGNSAQEKYRQVMTVPMQIIGTTNGLDIWEASATLKDIAVYGYHFEIYKSESDKVCLGDNSHKVDVPYVNIKGTGGIGEIVPFSKYIMPYTLTVYTNNYGMPKWSENMIIYYIFPERFKNGNKNNDYTIGKDKFYGKKDVEFHTNWNDPLPWRPGTDDGYKLDDNEYCNDFYGGDLDGVIQKLDYIKSLGVNVIYLNPIFKAPSNHKYDTADYLQVDPHFGDLATFKKLVAEAKKRGIVIILDTSLNHCGSDSVYMDRYAKYPVFGAFEGEVIQTNSPYYDWFEFVPKASTADQKYQQWANPTLANLKESDSYKKFAFIDKDSVTKYWMAQGAAGWRMDVTPWVTDQFWREWRKELKKSYPDSITFSEVWFDASKYLIGDMFDSSMNYIFRSSVINFTKGGNALKTVEALEMVRENYPAPVFYKLMNLVSGHDLPRVFYEIGYTKYDKKNYEKMKARLELVFVFQFTYPGAPAVYYGDEIGMTGGPDPFNRGPYPWQEDGGTYGNYDFLDFARKIAKIRIDNPVFSAGQFDILFCDEITISYKRWDDKNHAIVVMNNSKNKPSAFDWKNVAEGEYKDLLSGKSYTIKNGEPFELAPTQYAVLLKQ
ncbi:MAG: hypothetical protein A2Y33_10055 [Spirochaetes bacterium GWF1_51_8]|nr:MAG: hypothetical protein A2Y33_10055 [Spirochaetes bacterium GWF1_51_8]